MPVYMVNIDKPSKKVFELLEEFHMYIKFADNCWIIRTGEKPQDLSEKLQPLLKDSCFFVCELKKNYDGFQENEDLEYIKEMF